MYMSYGAHLAKAQRLVATVVIPVARSLGLLRCEQQRAQACYVLPDAPIIRWTTPHHP